MTPLAERIRSVLVGGLLVVLPFAITYLIFRWLYDIASGFLRPVVVNVFGRDIPGLSFGLLILLILLAGLITMNFVGRGAMYLLEAGLIRVPVIGSTYAVLKQLVTTLGPGGGTALNRVVVIEYPRSGMYALGFLTGWTTVNDIRCGAVYIPTSPTPNSGWLAIVPEAQIYESRLSGNQAISVTISAGVTVPQNLTASGQGRA